MDCQFRQLDIWYAASGGTEICWNMGANSYFRGRTHFYVDFGWPGTDEWVTLNEQPITDACCYYDLCPRNWADIIEAYYRVRLVLPDEAGCPVYKSQPTRANGRLNRTDWLYARDIIRREHLQQRKGREGTQGYLLKRKKFGTACPACLDWDTKEVTNSNCTTCYGTGFTGGYYPAVEFWITTAAGWTRQIVDGSPPRGTTSEIKKNGRCVLYPTIDTRDIWVRYDNDERYVIDGYTVLAQIQSVPLIAQARINLAPMTDIVYSVPLVPSVSSSSSDSSQSSSDSSAQCGVDSGLESPYEDW